MAKEWRKIWEADVIFTQTELDFIRAATYEADDPGNVEAQQIRAVATEDQLTVLALVVKKYDRLIEELIGQLTDDQTKAAIAAVRQGN